MTAEGGLRARKKERTRHALAEAAVRLFAERGYERTTVAEIAAAADVSTRTFFSYFPSKEDVLFAETEHRVRLALAVLADRHPQEGMPELLTRAFREVADSEAFRADLGGGPASARLRLISASPALQAAALRRLLQAQQSIAVALQRAYPDRLDLVTAAAVVGALVGATVGAALTSLAQGHDLERLRAEFARAVGIAVRGIGAVPPPGAG